MLATANFSNVTCVQVSLDPSGLYAAASSADKTVVLFDIFSGECVTKLYGHSGTMYMYTMHMEILPPPLPAKMRPW